MQTNKKYTHSFNGRFCFVHRRYTPKSGVEHAKVQFEDKRVASYIIADKLIALR